MTRRPAPRHLFVASGLTLLALAAWSDRGLLNMSPAPDSTEHPRHPDPALDALATADRALQAASGAFTDRLPAPGSSGAAYEAAYAEAAPAYREALRRYAERCLEAHAADPDNGVTEVSAGLALLDASVWPHASEPVRVGQRLARTTPHPERPFEVRDPVTLRRALDLIRQGLERPRLSYGESEAVRASLAAVEPADGTVGGTLTRFSRVVGFPVPSLLRLRGGLNQLVLVARSWRHTEAGDSREPLALGRRLGLRLGAEADTLIMTFMAVALDGIDLQGWQDEAVWRGDAELARAVQAELLALERAQHASSGLTVPVDRLGSLDRILMPNGGWTDRAFDPSLGRRVDYAHGESVLLWALLGLTALGLGRAFLQSRAALDATRPAAAAAGWTLGDLLAVVMPSVGLSAVLLLLAARLHPARVFGLTSDPSALRVALVQGAAALALAVGAGRILLRGAVLAKHGLSWPHPGRVRVAWGALSLGVLLALGWIGPHAETLLVPAVSSLVTGLVLAFAATGAGAFDPAQRTALRRYEGRVGLACFGFALTLVSALQLLAVGPRRAALVRAYDHQMVTLLEREAEAWGYGQLGGLLRRTLEAAPDRPTRRDLR